MIRITIQSILAVALLFGTASQASADLWGHIDRQANDIERSAKLLRTEVDHYRHTRSYGQLIGATARLKGQAIHVHNIADHSQCPKALKIAVAELGRAFVDAEYLFDQAEQNAAYGDGRINGNTAHVKQHLNSIGTCISNLQSDLLQLNRPVAVVRQPVVQRTVVRQPVVVREPVAVVREPVLVHATKVYRPATTVHRSYDQYRGFDQHRGYDRHRGHSHSSRGRVSQPVYRTGNRGGGLSLSIGGGSSRLVINF